LSLRQKAGSLDKRPGRQLFGYAPRHSSNFEDFKERSDETSFVRQPQLQLFGLLRICHFSEIALANLKILLYSTPASQEWVDMEHRAPNVKNIQ
jgi:hypothetical protein